MTLLSIFTPVPPSHIPFLEEAYRSLQRQTYQDFEWVLLPNHGAVVPTSVSFDPQVRVVRAADDGINGIGALKRAACLEARGDILLEMDADDLLAPNCLQRVAAAFSAGADFVYSDFAQFEDKPMGEVLWQRSAWA